jgi:predicted oxidoreductase (fatty acid repression mutant protein)
MSVATLPQADHATAQAFLDVIKRRRSIRKLAAGPLSDETLHTIVEAGRWAPSSSNSQPVRLVVVRERQAQFWDFVAEALATKLEGERLERAVNRIAGYRDGLFSIVFYEDLAVVNNPPAGIDLDTWRSFAVQALGIAQANVWNAIAAAGLAASNQHINLQIEDELRAFLSVPDSWKSYSIFPVGYAAEEPAEGTRHPHEHVVYYEYGPDGPSL